MRPVHDWENVKEAAEGRNAPPAGGYVARITKAEDVPEKEYLRFEFDISEGDYAKYGENCIERNGFTPLRFIRSYKEAAAGFFKGFISSVEKSNPAFRWAWDETALVGATIGVVLGEEEYRKQSGDIGTRLVVARTLTAADVRDGKFKVPEKKTLPAEAASSFAVPAVDAELPYNL